MPRRVPRYFKRLAFQEIDHVQRLRFRLPHEGIVAGLRQFGEMTAPVLMVHSSLSACGHVVGGAPTVIEALRAWAGPASLAMPVHAYCYPEAGCPVYEEGIMPSRVGVITETFRLSGAALFSVHPTHGLACGGPLARSICVGHDECDSQCGKGTPYERLVEHDAAVLFFGVTLDANTLFHTAENDADAPYAFKSELCRSLIRYRDGSERYMAFKRHDIHDLRRFSMVAPWLEERGLLRRAPLGRGELLYIPHARLVHQAVVEEIRRDPWFLTKRRWYADS